MSDLEVAEPEAELLPAVVDQRAVPSFSLDEMAAALTAAEQLKRHIMRRGVDYGTVPGAKKPSLYKAGAERACQFYGLSHRMERVEVERTAEGKPWGITYKCFVFKVLSDGREVPLGDCEGFAGYDESRFWDRVYEKSGPNKGNPKRDADGKDVLNPSPWNSVMKMADKRAYVGAVLKATGMSDFFTQDIEDYAASIPALPPPSDPRISPTNADRARARAEEAGLSEDEIAEMVDTATGGRTDDLAEVHKDEVGALREAMARIVARKQEMNYGQSFEAEDPGRAFEPAGETP